MDQLKDCATFFPHKTGHDLENGQPIEYDKRKTYPAKILDLNHKVVQHIFFYAYLPFHS